MVEKLPLRSTLGPLCFPTIAAFGNPLLDLLVIIKDDYLLKKYNLRVDGEMELCSEKMQELLADLPSEQNVSSGGSAQNTMRILQWIYTGSDNYEIGNEIGCYLGSIGKDWRGRMLENLVRGAGVQTRYAVHSPLPTGVCVSLVNESSRSLVANIGAAGVYTIDDLNKNLLLTSVVKIIYIEGFFITHSFPVAKELIKQAEKRNIMIVFNLNGTYIFKDHHTEICEMVAHAKIVFGNAREMAALAQSLNVKYDDVTDIPFLLNSLKRITFEVSSTTNEEWLRRGDIFVMTQGESAPAIVVWGKGQSAEVQPIPPKAPVIDTTGAGDALVAGFLAGVLARQTPKRCLEYGCKVASFIVTRLGVTLPADVPPDILQ